MLPAQKLLLGHHLAQQLAAHQAHTRHKDVNFARGTEEKFFVQHIECLAQRFGVDHQRYIALRRALCNRFYVNSVSAQGRKGLARQPGALLHVLSYHGQHTHLTLYPNLLYLPAA